MTRPSESVALFRRQHGGDDDRRGRGSDSIWEQRSRSHRASSRIRGEGEGMPAETKTVSRTSPSRSSPFDKSYRRRSTLISSPSHGAIQLLPRPILCQPSCRTTLAFAFALALALAHKPTSQPTSPKAHEGLTQNQALRPWC